MLPLPLMTMYFGWKPFFTSTPSWLRGRSLTCPMEATTAYFRLSSFLSVRALVGDSTTTSALALATIDSMAIRHPPAVSVPRQRLYQTSDLEHNQRPRRLRHRQGRARAAAGGGG